MALHSERLLNVINLASLRFHVSSLSQRNCFRSCQLQFVTSCQLPVADAVAVAVAVARCSLCSHGASFWLVVLAIVLALSLSWLFVKADSRIADDLCQWRRLVLADCRVTRRKLAAIDIGVLKYRKWRPTIRFSRILLAICKLFTNRLAKKESVDRLCIRYW